ncbi:hypothetical protein BH09ACT12_BH09ACT12_37670 [soil metagenome]
MTTLTDRLNGLADDAPGGADPADEALWTRGKRLQRRRQAVTASLVAVLVLAIGSITFLVGDSRPDPVPVADSPTALPLPDAIYEVSEWTPGTDETGPIGPLVAVTGGYRHLSTWGKATVGVAGVSAAGGYAYLDIEDPAGIDPADERIALSPDGRFLAYLVTGPTTDEPYTEYGEPAVGLGLYDTVTGETRRSDISTPHGLSVDALTWVGDSVLMSYLQINGFGSDGDGGSHVSASNPAVLRWDTGSGVVDPAADARDYPDLDLASQAGDEVVVPRGRRSYSIMAEDGTTEPLGRFDVPIDYVPVFLSPDGARVVTREDRDGAAVTGRVPSVVVVADVDGPDAGVTRRLDEELSGPVIGWRDDSHVIVTGFLDDEQVDTYISVDVDTGEREELLEMPRVSTAFPTQIAADALPGPTLAAPEPNGPGDPRRIVWLGGGILVLLAGAALWRRRVRR